MKVLECPLIKEKAYVDILNNGLKVIVIPKKESSKKYIIWGTNFGSVDNKFVVPESGEIVTLPDGVAHFLEHKMFEQKSGRNSLDTLMALGIDANAYTTNDHTAYLIECSEENFDAGLAELMDYVQNPYYTEENVEKEKGIIGQEIMMYDDDPGFQVYLNALKCLYHKNAVRLDIAGSIDSISGINPKMLYDSYNTFYNPDNMVLVLCGNFEPDEIMKKVKSHLKGIEEGNNADDIGELKGVGYTIKRKYDELTEESEGKIKIEDSESLIESKLKIESSKNAIKRIYPEEPDEIFKSYTETEMAISMPLFMLAIKDNFVNGKYETEADLEKGHKEIENKEIKNNNHECVKIEAKYGEIEARCEAQKDCVGFDKTYGEEIVRRHMAINILLELISGRSSKLFKELYEKQLMIVEPDSDYEFSKTYAHILVCGQSNNPQLVADMWKTEVENLKKNGINKIDFGRIKRKLYGDFVTEFNNVGEIARMFLTDSMKGINSFDYVNLYDKVTIEYATKILNEVFVEDKMALSIVNPKKS